MVKVKRTSNADKLEDVVRTLCEEFNFRLYISGWARRTFDIFTHEKKLTMAEHVARIESISATNGEIYCYDHRATKFSEKLASILEKDMGVEEAIIIHDKRPNEP